LSKLFLQNYFSYLKLGCQLLLMAYIVISQKTDIVEISFLVCLTAVVLLMSTLFESHEKNRWMWLLLGGMALIGGYLFVASEMILFLPFFLLDLWAGLLKLHERYPAGAFLFVLVGFVLPEINGFIYLLCALFCTVFYLQHYLILGYYRRQVSGYEQEENILKDAIDRHETKLKEELIKRSLSYENQILEERARLSQELHDKLGHSINGSIYQLEAGKALLLKDKEKSTLIIQDVIDNLRLGLDEIRLILRKKKPDKTQMAILQLHGLSTECREKYGIEMELDIQGDSSRVLDEVWEVILDNAYEAVTNALKYSGCRHINISLNIMNKVVRLNICDDGKGCCEFLPGMGIEGMRQRVRRLNGTMDIETLNGFSYTILLPNLRTEYE